MPSYSARTRAVSDGYARTEVAETVQDEDELHDLRLEGYDNMYEYDAAYLDQDDDDDDEDEFDQVQSGNLGQMLLARALIF